MSEKLSQQEMIELDEALEDGFKDDYLPGLKLEKVEMGDLFHTNPLSPDVVYVSSRSYFDDQSVRSVAQSENMDDSGFFKETNWSSETFWSIPFGFNFEKIQAYFEKKRKEVISEYTERYFGHSENEDAFNSSFEDRPSFEQWIESAQYPYTKRWFERHALTLSRRISFAINEIETSSEDDRSPENPFNGKMRNFWTKRYIADAVKLGRLDEHYRWKFQFEAQIVNRNQQYDQAGSSGGKASSTRRLANLEILMQQIEQLSGAVGLISEERIVEQALEKSVAKQKGFPKSHKTHADYGTALRSEEPFKSRYEAEFRKNA